MASYMLHCMRCTARVTHGWKTLSATILNSVQHISGESVALQDPSFTLSSSNLPATPTTDQCAPSRLQLAVVSCRLSGIALCWLTRLLQPCFDGVHLYVYSTGQLWQRSTGRRAGKTKPSRHLQYYHNSKRDFTFLYSGVCLFQK